MHELPSSAPDRGHPGGPSRTRSRTGHAIHLRANAGCRYNARLPRFRRSLAWKPNARTPSPKNSPTSPPGVANYGGIFDYDVKASKLEEVNRALEDPAVWNNAERAQELGKEKRVLEDVVLTLQHIDAQSRDLKDLYELAEAEDDDDTFEAVEADLGGLAADIEKLEFRRMFSNPMDPNNCFIEIQAGAGGTEAQDWAGMLERMYLRYAEKNGFSVELMEETEGEVAGIKNCTIKISGEYAYGYLRTETGIHRLVRKSPFDSNARRHTSFTSVFVYPEVDDSIEIEINPADLRIDTYRASGAGGQHITSTRPTPRCASRTSRPASSCSARTTVRSTRTRPKRCRC